MNISLIKKAYRLSQKHKKIVNTYLKSRGLKNSKIKPIGYLPYFEMNNFKIVDSILIPILDIEANIMGFETRSLKTDAKVRYNKVFTDEELFIPQYGLRNPNFTSEYVILTEGAFDTETLIQLGYNSVSGLRASMPSALLHFLAVFFDKIIIALDNDKSGINNTRRIIQFYSRYYPDLDIEVLEYKGKDINLAKQKYIKTLRSSLKKIIVS